MFGDILNDVAPADVFKQAHPYGCLADIITGRFVQGRKGNWHMVGGYCDIDSVVGPGNAAKTEQILDPCYTVLGHVGASSMLIYDTENSYTYDRAEGRKENYEGLEDFDFRGDIYTEKPRFMLTNRSKVEGDKIFEIVKRLAKARYKDKKSLLTLPWDDAQGNPDKGYPPFMLVIDSLSGFTVTSVNDNIVEKHNVGDSGQNVVFMKDGAAKTQLMAQLPIMSGRYGVFVSMTAHVGNYIKMDPYAPSPQSLTFAKNGTKHKGVPEKFTFYNTHVRDVYSNVPFTNPVDKAPMFPLTDADRDRSNDLLLITNINSRNKNGKSGITLPVVISQRDGINKPLTNLFYIKKMAGRKNFGVSGNDQRYSLDLLPDVQLTRTTARQSFEDSRILRNACRITAEILQIMLFWKYDPEIVVSPDVLYADIKAMGYDWNLLLDSRYHWTFDEDEPNQKYNELTVWDLFMIRAGQYHPYWLDRKDYTKVAKEWNKPYYAANWS